MAIDASCIESLLARIGNDNARRYYLTDIVGLARKMGGIAVLSQPMKTSLWGRQPRGSRARRKTVSGASAATMDEGVTLLDPDTVYFSHDTILGTDVIVQTSCSACVEVENNVEIRAFCHVEGQDIEGALIDPTHVSDGTEIGEDVTSVTLSN